MAGKNGTEFYFEGFKITISHVQRATGDVTDGVEIVQRQVVTVPGALMEKLKDDPRFLDLWPCAWFPNDPHAAGLEDWGRIAWRLEGELTASGYLYGHTAEDRARWAKDPRAGFEFFVDEVSDPLIGSPRAAFLARLKDEYQ